MKSGVEVRLRDRLFYGESALFFFLFVHSHYPSEPTAWYKPMLKGPSQILLLGTFFFEQKISQKSLLSKTILCHEASLI